MKSGQNRVIIFIVFLGCIASAPSEAEGSRQQAVVVIPEDKQVSYDSRGYAPAIRIGNVIYVSGVIARLEGEGSYDEQYALGFKSALRRIDEVLQEAGASLDDVIELTTYHTDIQRQLDTAMKVRMSEMKLPHPAWTAIGTTALASPFGVTEITVTAHIGE